MFNSLSSSSTLLAACIYFSFTILVGDASAQTKRNDPTKPLAAHYKVANKVESRTTAAYKLSAIFTRNDEQYAVINEQVLTVGDSIGNKRVAVISATNLILEDIEANEATVLELFNSTNVKTQVVK